MKIYTSKNIGTEDQALLAKVLGTGNEIVWLVEKQGHAAGGEIVETELHYICNPNGTIRWIYPAHLRRPLFLSTYNSPGKKAQLISFCIRFLFLIGMGRFLRSGRIFLDHQPKDVNFSQGLIPDPKSFSIFTGTPGPNRKAVIVFNKPGKQLQFAKVPVGELAGESLKNERGALKYVKELELDQWLTPPLERLGIGFSVVGDIKGDSVPSRPDFGTRHWEALVEMDDATRTNTEGLRGSFLAGIESRLRKLAKGEHMPGMPRLIAQLDRLLETVKRQGNIPFSYSHGDFTPWNMYVGRERLHVYDWEMAGPRPVLYDYFHFVFQTGVLVHRRDPGLMAHEIEKGLQNDWAQSILDQSGLDSKQFYGLYLLESVSANLLLFQQQKQLHEQAWWLMKAWSVSLETDFAGARMDSCRKVFLRELPGHISNRDFALMRGTEGPLEALSESSDLDFLVSPAGLKSIKELVSRHALVLKFQVFHQSFMDRLELHFVDGGFLSIDLLSDLRRKGVRMMLASDLMSHAVKDKYGIYRMTCEDQLEYAILFYGLNTTLMPERYRQIFADMPQPQRERFSESMNLKYGLDMDGLSLRRYSDDLAKNLRKRLLAQAFNRGTNRLTLQLQYFGDLVRRFVQSEGMVITFSGVDGAGKSTVLDATAEVIQKIYRKKVKVLRHRPSLLPILSALRYGRKGAEQRSMNSLPRQGNNRNFLSSLFRFSWYYLDYLIGQWYVWLRYERRGYVVLYDRYFYDMLADSERTNLNLPAGLLNLASKLVRKPDLNFFLVADPEIIRARKQELSHDDIVLLTGRYNALFRKLSDRFTRKKFVTLSNLGITDSVDRILNAYRQAI